MKSTVTLQSPTWERLRTRGKSRFVLVGAGLWFAVVGLVPLPYFLAHAIVPEILPLVLGIAIVSGVLIADVAWHLMDCGYRERTEAGSARALVKRRAVLHHFLWIPVSSFVVVLVAPSADLGRPGLVIGAVTVLASLLTLLAVFERAMRPAA